MFDLKAYISDVEEVVSASQRPLSEDVFQPEFYYSVLRASILKLPDDWDCHVQRLILRERHPSLQQVIEVLTEDMKHSKENIERLQAFEALSRFAVVLASHESRMRSSGPE